MKIKEFLSTLVYFHEDQINGMPIICKFYTQPTSFSFELRYKYSGEKVSNSGIIYESEIYYNWIDESDTRKQIIDDIVSAVDIEEVQQKLLKEIYKHSLKKLKYPE